ncbi:helix-turn-helix transcriptional regulator [bacterium]|nr:helix-turn-helix transcriptional regulator [bacterium]
MYDLALLGKKIRIERVKNDLSQEKLAEKVGVSTRTISLIESGLQHPKFFLVVRIAEVLDFDINVLLEDKL